jgi:small subunit ribosomal protein S2
MSYVTMKQMLETGVHFGHQTRRWNPKMRPFIFGARNGIHIIDLQQTVKLFQKAHDFVADTVASGGTVIFVGTKRQAQEAIRNEAGNCQMPYITHRWLGGTMTNFQTIRKSIERLKKLEAMFEDGTINRYGKKEVSMYTRELEKLEQNLGGIKHINELPQAAFIIDPKREEIAVKECRRLGIPIAAVVDTNCDPDVIDYVIPGNDDAIRAIKLFVAHMAEAVQEGLARRVDTGEPEAKGKPKAEIKAEPAASEKADEPAVSDDLSEEVK